MVRVSWARRGALAAVLVACSCEALVGVDRNQQAADGGTVMACGNGSVDPGEACDVGIIAGDGACPADCDDGNSCTADTLLGAGCAAHCLHDPLPNCCGNGRLDQGESCDDANQQDFDGCSRDCRFERVLVMDSLDITASDEGCDLDGDGIVDNGLSAAMNDNAREFTSTYLTNSQLHSHRLVALWLMAGTDSSMQTGWGSGFVVGQDLDQSLDDNYGGSEPFAVRAENLDAQGRLALPLQGIAPGGALMASAIAMNQPIPNKDDSAISLVINGAIASGTLMSDSSGPTAFDGRLCGVLGAVSLYRFRNETSLGPGETLLDLLVLGLDGLGYLITPTQPEVDVDADGLERFVDTDGDHVIDLCIDGNGTQIVGMTCPEDPRIADGYSFAYDWTAVRAVLAGRAH